MWYGFVIAAGAFLAWLCFLIVGAAFYGATRITETSPPVPSLPIPEELKSDPLSEEEIEEIRNYRS